MNNNNKHYYNPDGDNKQYYKPNSSKGPLYYNPKGRGLIYRHPKVFVGVTSGVALLIFFSKPIYDFFIDPKTSRILAQEEYHKFKPRFAKDSEK